ncbi:MAG: hypothetical protein KKE02_05595 [Alphaproteobacteria bacterium]|nr:hypothetical protein [Alphaproteobacteria bacterium]MBU1513909.1 hypothetical protein [Alphaproteobacteria bacterium]MBU2094175.1 hypothetical protein [Alphaproteobacteria bacterium]MBU2150473.1 hypothetical protein [Alphaproteobacteria bacterium]MBU2307665.1 hypothetical protein [Alphaproteobacteria bacterium]
MKPLYLVAASALALTAAACGPKVPAARAALDCPPTQGDLTRTAVAPDGKACTYVNEGGAEVTLQLVSVTGSPDATLSAIETNLLANRGAPHPQTPKGEAPAKASGEAAKDAARAAKEAADDTKGVTVDIRLDEKDRDTGVVTEGHGTTRVNLPGIHVVANDRDDTANVKVGPITIDAGNDGATVRMRRDVRLRGEAFNPEKRGVRATFLYTGDDLPEGYRFVGYEAGGPKRGPITVAVVKSKSEGPDGGDLYPDVKKLVRKNGGV